MTSQLGGSGRLAKPRENGRFGVIRESGSQCTARSGCSRERTQRFPQPINVAVQRVGGYRVPLCTDRVGNPLSRKSLVGSSGQKAQNPKLDRAQPYGEASQLHTVGVRGGNAIGPQLLVALTNLFRAARQLAAASLLVFRAAVVTHWVVQPSVFSLPPPLRTAARTLRRVGVYVV